MRYGASCCSQRAFASPGITVPLPAVVRREIAHAATFAVKGVNQDINIAAVVYPNSYFSMASNSTSKTSVAFGGTAFPAPRSP